LYRTYQLLIDVTRPVQVRIGRLGEFRLAAGRYVYTGSARRNLETRIARHARRDKRLRWHIDYLLACRDVRLAQVRRSKVPECALNHRTRGTIPVPGFGASDCRAGCVSHLKYRGASPHHGDLP
jgi:Uri superfamily endonuclease